MEYLIGVWLIIGLFGLGTELGIREVANKELDFIDAILIFFSFMLFGPFITGISVGKFMQAMVSK